MGTGWGGSGEGVWGGDGEQVACLCHGMWVQFIAEEVIRLTFRELQSNKLDGTTVAYRPMVNVIYSCT